MSTTTATAELISMDIPHLAELLHQAASEVFEVMLGATLNDLSGVFSPEPDDVTAIIGLAGVLCGSISIRCHGRTANAIAAQMLGTTDAAVIAEQRLDAAGEVCNMIAGAFKGRLPTAGSACMLSVPTVVTGGDYHVYTLAAGGKVQIILEFENEPICLSLELKV